MHLIPADAHEFYTNLTGNSVIEEDVNGYNETLDFVILILKLLIMINNKITFFKIV
jgi:hypothetical protein